MSKKQITLFQTWNKTSSQSDRNYLGTDRNVCSPVHQFHSVNEASTSTSSPSLFKSLGYSKKTDELVDPEFDYEAGKTWIYPTNYPVRDYQFSIVKEALFKNTLVVLPTGLGKTFIAAVVMYNIYRWFPNGKVVFMAPTKPLVAQQVDACFNITGVPYEDTTQMTGTNAPELRKRMWQKKRVFFLTPQVLVNDLVRNICPASSIKCLVVDEAHKALGNHAYCQVIKELSNYTSEFRVLALTATPGSDPQAVKHVLSNLLISHVEMRTEDSADVQQYTHIRDIEKIIVPLGDRLNTLKSRFLDVINMYLKRLTLRKVMSANKNPASLSKYQVLKLREAFSQNPPANIDRVTYGLAMADFSLLISLYHAYELLLLHGARSFYNFLLGILNGDKSIPHARAELLKNFEFEEIMESVKNNYIPEPLDPNAVQNGQMNAKKKKVLPGHPKLDKLIEIVLEHFRLANFENLIDTRVMIFTQYRDSVQEIVDLLNQHQPTIKVMSFIGQASKSISSAGFSQKQQLKVLQQFRSGGYNTLVSTCVGEEGLDIGEVDLIVCYDCPKSPIRLVQRMGRTGRLRKGRIVILIAEGKEEQMYNTCEHRKKSVHRAISKGFSFAQFYQDCPSLLPPNVVPKCVKTAIIIKEKKPEPKVKVVSNTPFLNDEEMEEFNQHVKVPMSDAPLLPKREFIVLKNQEDLASTSVPSVEPQLSLHKWTLWQTTPQRTDMIPHSSKSLLLVRSLEHINFPEISKSKFLPSQISDFSRTSFLSISTNHSKKSKHSRVSSRQSKITDCLSASKIEINDEKVLSADDDVIEICPSPEREVDKAIIPYTKNDCKLKKMPFIEQVLKVNIPNPLGEINPGDIKSPPVIEQLLNIEDFYSVNIEDFSVIETKSSSILRNLNNKMKERLKRKQVEINRNIVFKDNQLATLSENINLLNDVNIIENKCVSSEISVDNNDLLSVTKQKNNQDKLETVVFDIDFDIPDAFEDSVRFDEDLDINKLTNVARSNDNKLQSTKKDFESVNFDDDFLKAKNQENLNHPTGSVIMDKSSKEPNHDINLSDDYHNFHEIKKSPKESTKLAETSAKPLDGVTHEKKSAPIQREFDSFKNIKDSSIIRNIHQNNSTNFPNDIVTENESPTSINFDINFFEDDVEFLSFNNDNPVKVSNEACEMTKINVNVPISSDNNKEIFLMPNQPNEHQVNNENKNVEFPIGLAACKEKQSSVLKDVKNIHHLSNHGKNLEQKNNSYLKSYSNEENNNKLKSLQTLDIAEEINSNSINDGKFTSSNSGGKHKNNDSHLPSECLNNKVKKSQDVIEADNLTDSKFQRHDPCVDASSPTLLYNVTNMLNNSLNNCTNDKLLPKQINNKYLNAINEKNTFRNIATNSTNSACGNVQHLLELNIKPQNIEKAENANECNFDFDVSFLNNDLEDISSSKPNVSSESTKIYSFTKHSGFDDDLDQFDKGASSILKQLCSSQKSAPSDLNSSFSSLTVKRCISESNLKENLKRKKLCRTLDNTSDHQNNSRVMHDTENLRDSDIFKVPNNVRKRLHADSFSNIAENNLNISNRNNSSQENLNKTVKATGEASQYSLTQLLSFINSSESIEKSHLERTLNKSPKHLQNTSEISDISSEDEVCPTPPKKIIKPNTEFIYSKGRSLDFKNFELPHKHSDSSEPPEIIQKELKPLHTTVNIFKTPEKNPKNANFHRFTSKIDQNNANSCSSADFVSGTKNEIKDRTDECELSPKITFDVSFDLPFTQNEFEISEKDDVIDMNNAILIGSSSSEEKLLSSQNDDVESLKPMGNENQKRELSSEALADNLSKKDEGSLNKMSVGNEIVDEMFFEDSESLLSSKLNHDCELATVNNAVSKKCVASNSVACNSKSVNEVSNISVQNAGDCVEKFGSNDFQQSNEENLDDFENSIFYKLLLPEDTTDADKQSLSVENDLKCKTSKHGSNVENTSKTSKKDQAVEKSSNIDISNVVDIKAGFTSKSTEIPNGNNSFSKAFKTENEFKSAKIISKEKNSNGLVDLCEQNMPQIEALDDEFTEEKLCFDLTFEDETCELLPLKNSSINNSQSELLKNAATVPKSSKSTVELETKGGFKNIIKKTTFKKIDVKEALSEATFVEKDTSKYDKGEIESGVNKNQSCLLGIERNNISVYNGGEKSTHNIACNNSSDEFDVYDQHQTIKNVSKTNIQMKNSNAGCSKQESNLPKNKLSSKLTRNKKTVAKTVLKNNNIIDDEDDDFQFIQKIEKKTTNHTASKKRKRKGLSNRNEFLLSQAEVSESDNSAHESDYEDDEDAFDGSFIDDESPAKMAYTDQHAFYLKSLNDCVGLPQKFKLKPLENHSIISQPEERYSNYELDSFCVDDDVVLLTSDEDIDHNEYNSANKQKWARNKNSKRKLKRVVTHDSSTSSEHDTSPKFRKHTKDSTHLNNVDCSSQNESLIVIRKPKKRILESSDEEDDGAFIKPAIPDFNKRNEHVSALVNSTLENVDANVDSGQNIDEKLMFSIDFGDDIEFIEEMNPPVDETVLQKPHINKTCDLNNFEGKSSLQKPSSSKDEHSRLNVKDAEPSAVDENITDISFDIGWYETCPSTSGNVKTSTMNDTVSSAANENIYNSVMVDTNNTASVILVDSRELASGKPVISSLRNKHKINPVVMHLTAADYVISNRIAIERVFDSEFSNQSVPPKIVEKIKEMMDIYLKNVVIIEKDSRKNILSFNKNVTKYLQFVIHLNFKPQVKVLFSKSADHTSELIANLVQQEKNRGFHISVPVCLNSKNQKLFDFYSSFPKMTPTCALNFMYYFPTVELLFKSSVKDLKKKGCISSQKAASLYKYFRSNLTFSEKL